MIRDDYGTSVVRDEFEAAQGFILRPSCVFLGGKVGRGTKIGSHCVMQEDVEIGENCKIQSHVVMAAGLRIGNGVFVGPGVLFMDDREPRAVDDEGNLVGPRAFEISRIVVEDGAVLGGGVKVVGPVVIGPGAFVCAGSLVTRDVPAGTRVFGVPAFPFPWGAKFVEGGPGREER